MNVYCLTGLHAGVFQGLDQKFCKHTFWVPNWDDNKPKPNNVNVMTKNMIDDPDEKFFDAILIFPEHYDKVKNLDKTIIVYFVMNGREGSVNSYTKFILSNPKVIPVFVSTSCRLSHGVYEGLHKTIYPGIDEDLWSGWTGEKKKIIHVRNSFQQRDGAKFKDFTNVCAEFPYTLVGHGGNLTCGTEELIEQFRKHRVFVNIEIYTSTFSISSMEAMMTGMPIICNDIEGTGEAVRNGIEGFVSNNLVFLRNKTRELMNDHAMASEFGKNAREMAKIKFGKKQFNLAWNDLLTNIDFYKRN